MATIRGTRGNDNINGTPNRDSINALGGNDRVNANGGDDYANGNEGNDSVSGNNGGDRVQGGPGNDSLNGNAGNDVLFGDTLVASEVGSDAFIYNTAQGNDRILDFVNSPGSTAGENDMIVIQDATTAELEATFGPNGAVDDTDQGVSFANGDLQINFAQVVDPTNTYGNGILRLEGPFVSNFPDGLLIGTDIIGGETVG